MKLTTKKNESEWILKFTPSWKDLIFSLLIFSPAIWMVFRLFYNPFLYNSTEEWIWTILSVFVFSFLGTSMYPDESQVIINKTQLIVRFVKTNKLDQWDGKIKKEFIANVNQVLDFIIESEYENSKDAVLNDEPVNPNMGDFEKSYREKKRLKLEKQQKNRWRLMVLLDSYKIPLMEGYVVGDAYKLELEGIKEEMTSNLNNFKMKEKT